MPFKAAVASACGVSTTAVTGLIVSQGGQPTKSPPLSPPYTYALLTSVKQTSSFKDSRTGCTTFYRIFHDFLTTFYRIFHDFLSGRRLRQQSRQLLSGINVQYNVNAAVTQTSTPSGSSSGSTSTTGSSTGSRLI